MEKRKKEVKWQYESGCWENSHYNSSSYHQYLSYHSYSCDLSSDEAEVDDDDDEEEEEEENNKDDDDDDSES